MRIVSVFNCEGPPVPIPNTVVKLTRAYNTWLETTREDRSMLTLFRRSQREQGITISPCFSLRTKYSSLAQSVERMTVNHDVAGSSPAGGAKDHSTHLSAVVFLSVVVEQNSVCASRYAGAVSAANEHSWSVRAQQGEPEKIVS